MLPDNDNVDSQMFWLQKPEIHQFDAYDDIPDFKGVTVRCFVDAMKTPTKIIVGTM